MTDLMLASSHYGYGGGLIGLLIVIILVAVVLRLLGLI